MGANILIGDASPGGNRDGSDGAKHTTIVARQIRGFIFKAYTMVAMLATMQDIALEHPGINDGTLVRSPRRTRRDHKRLRRRK